MAPNPRENLEPWGRSVSVRETVAIILSNHHKAAGLPTSQAWTCVCGWQASGGRRIGGGYLAGCYEHMADVLSRYGYLAPEGVKAV